MTPALTDWPRPYWHASDETALLLFFVFGTFAQTLRIPTAAYDSAGLPEGLELHRYPNTALAQWEGYPLRGALGDVLAHDNPQACAVATDAAEVISVRGRIADPANLNYLRDTVGVLAGLLDLGGTAVVDPQTLSIFDANAWRERYLVAHGAPPRNHVLIVASDDADGKVWVHTRGMRKFGRPDLSVRGVPGDAAEHAGALCERLVEMQALGAHLEDGQQLEVDGLSAPLVVQHAGNPDDPQFNNAHIALRWP